MFDFRRLLHLGKPERQAAREQAVGTALAAEPVKLVAITEKPDDSVALRQIASNYRWRILIVGSSDAAVASLNEQPTPLVICDRDLASEDWREVLAKIAALPQAVCVLLASRVVDDYLWRQVIRHHGYDVVSKPFQPEEVRRAVTFAWSWRGWAHRHYSEVLGKPTA
jgi:response regulator RpfG family c-di-GMP phosphodiesterase